MGNQYYDLDHQIADEVAALQAAGGGNPTMGGDVSGTASAATVNTILGGQTPVSTATTLSGDVGGTPAATIIQALGGTKYFRAPTGGDDGSTMQGYINAGYTKIVLGPATQVAPFKWTTVPTVPNGVNVEFEGSGIKATYVQASGTHARFVDPGKTADYQTFGYTARRFTFDANSVSGSDSCFGSYVNGTTTPRVNWSNVLCEDIDIVNLPAPTGSTTTTPCGFYFITGQAVGDTATATLTDIRFNRCRCFGGRIGFAIGAPGTPNASFITQWDRCHIMDCFHDTGVTPVNPQGQSWANFQLGINGIGGFDNSIRNCIGKNSCDVGVETDAASRVKIENVDIYNSFNDHFLHVPFQQVPDVYSAELIYSMCRGITQSGNSAPTGGTFYGKASGTNTTGHIIYDNCWSIWQSGTTLASGATFYPFQIGVNTTQLPCTGVTYRDCHIDMGGASGLSYNSASQAEFYFWSLSPGQVGGLNSRVAFEGQNIVHWNVTQASTGIVDVRGLCLNQSNGITFDCEGGSVVVDYNSPSQSASHTILYNMAIQTSTSGKGVLPRLVVNSFAGGDTTPTAVKVPGSAGFTIQSQLVVLPDGSDLSGLPSTATELSITPNNSVKCRVGKKIRWAVNNPLKHAAMATSNFTTATFTTGTWNQYIAPYDGVLDFLQGSGAAITTIDLSPDNGTSTVGVLNQASGAMPAGANLKVPISTGWYVRVNFTTTQPTVTIIPQT